MQLMMLAGLWVRFLLSHEQLFGLSKRTIIVTGAASGIGASAVEYLAGAGANVVAVDRDEARLRELGDRLNGVTIVTADITDESAVQALVSTALRITGEIDGLLNAAGIGMPSPPENESLAAFRRVLDVNLVGTFLMCREVGRAMLAQGRGSVVNVSSVNGLVSSFGEASYCASKGGVIALTRELAVQWAPSGVRVNSVAPGYITTPMTAEMSDDPTTASYMAKSPSGRPGRPSELHGAFAYLLSDASSYVIGHTLVVDGGWTAE